MIIKGLSKLTRHNIFVHIRTAVIGAAIAYTIYQYTISNRKKNVAVEVEVDELSDDLGGEL